MIAKMRICARMGNNDRLCSDSEPGTSSAHRLAEAWSIGRSGRITITVGRKLGPERDHQIGQRTLRRLQLHVDRPQKCKLGAMDGACQILVEFLSAGIKPEGAHPMAVKTGTGLMAVWADIAPEVEAEFNQWYDTEHIPERMNVPGFLSGVRYTAIEGFLSYTPVERPPKYLVLYELADENVVTSEAYLKLLKSPTPWTQRAARYFRNNSRCVYRQILTQGNQPDKTADSVLCSRMNVTPEHESEFNEWYNVDHVPALVGVPGVICARRFVAIESEPKYLVIYQLKDAQVLKSEAWHRARNSDWTKRMRLLRRDVKSGVWRRAKT
jgi:hypothetical protein